MKEVKQFSKSYIFISALYVVLGIVLLAWPMLSVQMICYGFTIAMIVIGFSYGIMYFTKDNLEGFQQMDLVIGIICLAFGIFIFLNPTFLSSVLPFAIGIILLLGAIVKIQSAFNMKKLRLKKMVSDSDLCACSWSARSGASLESVPGGKIYDSLHRDLPDPGRTDEPDQPDLHSDTSSEAEKDSESKSGYRSEGAA